jgi:ATP-dependent RNA circularization protein (DNA/RNA ligase family)
MTGFCRFPHTPHLAWLGSGTPRDDKLLSSPEARSLLTGSVVVEEKLDGANLGISLDPDGALRFQNRGQYLEPPYSGQFQRLTPWIARHQSALSEVLGEGPILFGEWCAARHSVAYDQLPDWFLVFDVYDRVRGRFWSTNRRDMFAHRVGLPVVPQLFDGHTTLAALKALVTTAKSLFGSGTVEGLIVRKQSAEWPTARAKLVRADFAQNIGDHWRQRAIEWNRMQPATCDLDRTRSG